MIFIVKGLPDFGRDSLPQRLAKAVNRRPPAWPLDDEMLREWQQGLEGWWEADPAFFLETWSVDVDRVISLVLLRHRQHYPQPPQWSADASRRDFERWRDTTCLEVATRRMPEVFQLTCELMESVRHPVLNGSELGTSPKDSNLTRMVLFRHSDTPRLRILVQDAYHGSEPRVVVHGNSLDPDRLLAGITLDDDGEVRLSPELQP